MLVRTVRLQRPPADHVGLSGRLGRSVGQAASGALTKRNEHRRCFATESERVGFIGLGKIGYAMARNIMDDGISLVVYDPIDEAVARLVAAGAQRADSAATAAAGVSRVVTVLPNDAAMRAVVAEVAPVLPAGAVHVSCSTVSPHTSREVAAMHGDRGQQFVAAPIFARPDGMAAAQATIPVSGPAAAVARVVPLLEATSTSVVDFGEEVGAANVVKLGGNFLIAAAIESMSEALALAVRRHSCGPPPSPPRPRGAV